MKSDEIKKYVKDLFKKSKRKHKEKFPIYPFPTALFNKIGAKHIDPSMLLNPLHSQEEINRFANNNEINKVLDLYAVVCKYCFLWDAIINRTLERKLTGKMFENETDRQNFNTMADYKQEWENLKTCLSVWIKSKLLNDDISDLADAWFEDPREK